MSKHEIYVSFGLFDFTEMTPDELTEFLDIKPVFIRTIGHPIKQGSTILADANAWKTESPLTAVSVHLPLKDKLDALISVLKPKKEQLKLLCDKHYSEFSFTLYIYTDSDESTPPVYLEKEQINFINYLGSECDFDIILVSDTMPEDYDVDDW